MFYEQPSGVEGFGGGSSMLDMDDYGLALESYVLCMRLPASTQMQKWWGIANTNTLM